MYLAVNEILQKQGGRRSGKTFQGVFVSLLREWLRQQHVGSAAEGSPASEGIASSLTIEKDTSTVAESTGDWRIEMASQVLGSDHPIAPAALEANILTCHMAVEMYEAQREKDAAAKLSSQEVGSIPAEEQERRIATANERLRQIHQAIEELRRDHARNHRPVSSKRRA